jgi:hypothetical protein
MWVGRGARVSHYGSLKRYFYGQKFDLQTLANSENFENLEASTRDIVVAVLQNRSISAEDIDAQTAELTGIHQKEAVAAALRHKDVKSTLLVTIEDINQLHSLEHGITRQEIQKVTCKAANLRAHIDKTSDEIKSPIKATSKANGTKGKSETCRKNKRGVCLVSCHGSDPFRSHGMLSFFD